MRTHKDTNLLLDTTLPSYIIAGSFQSPGEPVNFTYKKVQFHGGDALVPFLQRFLKKNSLSFHQLGGISVAQGPGSFTAVRLGIVVAAALAYSLHIPVVGVPLPKTEEPVGRREIQQRMRTLIAKGIRKKPGSYKNLRAVYGKPPNITQSKELIKTQ